MRRKEEDMNKLMLTATVILVMALSAPAALAEPEPGFTIYETCHHYLAINRTSGEHLTIRKRSMHDELNRQTPYTVCAEAVDFTGPPIRTFEPADTGQGNEVASAAAGAYRIERPVVMHLGGACDRTISGIIVCREPDVAAQRQPVPAGPRH
jgi:hypothetical protein